MIFAVFIGVSALLAVIGRKFKKSTYVFLLFAFVWFINGFRDFSVGADTANYVRMFQNIGNEPFSALFDSNVEAGYLIFTKIIHFFTGDPRNFLLIVALIIAFSYGWFIYKNAESVYLAFLAYMAFGLFTFHLTGVRQSIALAICLFAIEFIKNKKFFPFLLLVLLATTFHTSAYLFLLAYPVGRLSSSRKNLVWISIFGFAGVIFIEPLSNLIAGLSERYEMYGIERTENGYIFFIIVTLITILAEIYKKQILEQSPSAALFINLNYISFFLWMARLITRVAERPSLFFMPATILVMLEILKVGAHGKRERFVLYLVVGGLLIALYLYRTMGMSYSFGF